MLTVVKKKRHPKSLRNLIKSKVRVIIGLDLRHLTGEDDICRFEGTLVKAYAYVEGDALSPKQNGLFRSNGELFSEGLTRCLYRLSKYYHNPSSSSLNRFYNFLDSQEIIKSASLPEKLGG